MPEIAQEHNSEPAVSPSMVTDPEVLTPVLPTEHSHRHFEDERHEAYYESILSSLKEGQHQVSPFSKHAPYYDLFSTACEQAQKDTGKTLHIVTTTNLGQDYSRVAYLK